MVSTTRCSVISLTVRVFGTATSMPDCNTGAVIMKITSSTSTTSTIGVMLISSSEVSVLPLLLVKATFNLARYFAPTFRHHSTRWSNGAHFFQRIEQLAAEVVDGRGEDADTRGELVVGHHGRNRHKQAGGGGDQRL